MKKIPNTIRSTPRIANASDALLSLFRRFRNSFLPARYSDKPAMCRTEIGTFLIIDNVRSLSRPDMYQSTSIYPRGVKLNINKEAGKPPASNSIPVTARLSLNGGTTAA